MRISKFKNQTIYVFLGLFFSLFISASSALFIVRILSQNDYGIYKKIFFTIVLLAPLFKVNFDNGLFYFYHKFNKDKSKYVANAYLFLLSISILILLIGVILYKNFGDSLLVRYPKYFLPFLILFSLDVFQGTFNKLFIIEGDSKKSFYLLLFYNFIKTFLIINALLLWSNLIYLLNVIIIVECIKTIICISYLLKKYNFNYNIYDKNILCQMFLYNKWITFSKILGVLGQSIDKIFIAVFLSNSEFALYAIGSIQVPILIMFYESIGEITLTKISRIPLKKKKKIKSLYKKMLFTNCLITIPILCYCFMNAEIVITTIFGNIYKDSALIFIITNLSMLSKMTGIGYVIRGIGATKPLMISNFVRIIFGVPLSYVCINYYGLVGAALASVIIFSIHFFILFFYSSKILKFSFYKIVPFKKIFYIIIISLFSLFITNSMKPFFQESVYYLIFSLILYSFVVFYLFYKNNLLNIEEWRIF